MELAPEKLREMLRLMLAIRAFEIKAQELFKEGLARGCFLGALHSYEGQEAVAVGACACLNREDYVFSTHRGHGHCIAKGADMGRMLAELQGKEAGYSRGRGGSMHLFHPDNGLMGGNGIVGGGISLALGTAFSAQYRGTSQVTVCFFGDGAAAQGTFHESLNLASLWKLPVIYICENNLYAATTPLSDSWSVPDLSAHGPAHGCPAEVVDGNDVLAVYAAVQRAVARARQGQGPSLIEARTYRHHPHCMVIPEHRPKEEIERWKACDPIPRFQNYLRERGILSEAEQAALQREVQEQVEQAAAFARAASLPAPETVSDGLWA